MNSNPLYLNNRLCSGRGRTMDEYTKQELIAIAKDNNIKVSSSMTKREICNRILSNERYTIPEFKPRRPIFKSIEHLMEYLDIEDINLLVELNKKELEDLINKLNLYDGSITMRAYLNGYEGSERVKQLLLELAAKFCRCLKVLESRDKPSAISPVAVCSSTIFNNRGLKGPGRNFQCDPIPLLLPSGFSQLKKRPKDSKLLYVLKKK